MEPRESCVVGLGCMRLSTDADRDETRALWTMEAAVTSGIALFDTARAYAHDDSELGHNERLLASVLKRHPAVRARVVTKGGMRRPGGRWEADGRARTIRGDCEASLADLAPAPIDLYLLHAPDPKVALATSVRALAELVEKGLVRGVGLSNVNRRQLDEAARIAPISAVEVALGPFADGALRGGVVARCIELGVAVLAHSPLGGPSRAGRLSRDSVLAGIAARHGVTAQRVAIAAISDLHPLVTPLAGARKPETVASLATALELDEDDRARLRERYGWRDMVSTPRAAATDGAELVLVMGIQGSGKSSAVSAWTERRFVRVNRDERGGTLRRLHDAVDALLASGAKGVVLDNTYTTRAQRHAAIEVARKNGARVTGVWLDTPVYEAQHNIVLRMLAEHGRLLEPEELERGKEPSALGPAALLRTLRAVEEPVLDEGFSSLERVPFARRASSGSRPATFFALGALERGVRPEGELSVIFGWRPEATPEWVQAEERALDCPVLVCRHPGGPPRCWCRPPLPGLLVAFSERHGVSLALSTVVGTKPLHAALARAVGASYRQV